VAVPGAENYFGFVFSMVLSFGLAFELPVVILLLAAAGLVTPRLLNRYRRHAVVLIVVLSAFLTPGDFVWSTLAMAVPLYLLYELSVLASFAVYRSRTRQTDTVAALLAPILALRALMRALASPRPVRHRVV
jgi:sec-independent protein translocase protein TatC